MLHQERKQQKNSDETAQKHSLHKSGFANKHQPYQSMDTEETKLENNNVYFNQKINEMTATVCKCVSKKSFHNRLELCTTVNCNFLKSFCTKRWDQAIKIIKTKLWY